MRPRSRLPEIRQLDPVRDHQRIVHLDCCYEFPFDFTRSLEFALFRTYCVPSISGLLARTGEFIRCPQKRYDDTDLLVSEMMEWGYESPRGAAALARMNSIHSRFAIANDDFLYVLSTFVFEPIRWIDQFGWRKLEEIEKLAYFTFWREVGARMGIRDIPTSFDAFEQFNRGYEQSRFTPAESNQLIGRATQELFAGWFPRPLRPLVRKSIRAMLDDPTRRAFGLEEVSPLWRSWVFSALRARAGLLRFIPVRGRPRLRTLTPHPSYPQGYSIDEIGPAWAVSDDRPRSPR